MKKILVVFLALLFVTACHKETDEILVTQPDADALALQDLPQNPSPDEITIPEATFTLKHFEFNVLKNAHLDPSTLEPALVEALLKAGHSFDEEKLANIKAAPPTGDIMLAFDLTGSMGPAINNAKINGENAMNAVRAIIPDTKFGVISHMDYNGVFSGCGYGPARYGVGSDYPYRLDQQLTDAIPDAVGAINSLALGSGADGPESYSRVLYEAVNDPNIGWRENSKKILIFFLDSYPHDCDLGYGPDPGRDEIVGTGDDIELDPALAALAAENITLIVVDSYGSVQTFWNDKAAVTGGQAYHLGDDVATTVTTLVEEEVSMLDELTLEVCTPGFESWLTDVSPAAYYDVELPGDFDFDVTFTVPAGTPEGVYEFKVCAIADGVTYAEQDVVITVYKNIALDVHPGSCPNPLNRAKKGVVPMALLGTVDFDVTEVNPETVEIEGVSPLRWELEDVGAPYMPMVDKPMDRYACNETEPDGIMDLTFKFSAPEIAALFIGNEKGEVVVVTITGELMDGTPFIGEDIVWIVK